MFALWKAFSFYSVSLIEETTKNCWSLPILHPFRAPHGFQNALSWLCIFLLWPMMFCFPSLAPREHLYLQDLEVGTLTVTTYALPTATSHMLLEVHWLKCNNYSTYCQRDLLRHKVGENKYLSFSINPYVSRCTMHRESERNSILTRSMRPPGS